MQESSTRRSNRARTEATRTKLIEAARSLFVSKGYADTATPEIVAAAGVTRGALYHHFADKLALFRAVVEQESAAVAREIEGAAPESASPKESLLEGGAAFLKAMADAGRVRLLLLDAPAVLGPEVVERIDSANSAATLRQGLAGAMQEGVLRSASLDALTTLLSAAFDRAALAVAAGAPLRDYQAAMAMLIGGLVEAPPE